MFGFDFFGRIRRKTAEAILGGAADAFAVLTPDGTPPGDLDELRKMLAEATAPRQLPPAKDEDEPARKAKK